MSEIIVAGGTFEKDYFDDGTLGFYDEEHETAVDAILKQTKAFGHTVNVAMLIDSLDMNDEHRNKLTERVRLSDENRIVIVHGTDTMVDSAKTVQSEAGIDKTVVFTGAMRPHRLGSSDGAFNLGFAIANATLLPSGVYIAMNGELFTPRNVRKNLEEGKFERISA